VSWRQLLARALLAGAALAVGCAARSAPPPERAPRVDSPPRLLSDDARRAFLEAYAPVILKAADERALKHAGQDLLTNFFFDGDRDLSNNKARWSRELRRWLAGDAAQANWSLRPTLYTALIELRDAEGGKSLVLLYHLYHAKQQGSIHDWERVELRLDGVADAPGRGERVTYAVVTEHSIHRRVPPPRPGARLVIWQAPWTKRGPGRKSELRATTSDPSQLSPQAPAQVEVKGLGLQPFHYVFAPAGVSFLGRPGATLSQDSARQQVALREPPRARGVRVLSYELQDLADILPTHLDPRSWRDEVRVSLETPVRDAEGRVTIPAGETAFLFRARDAQDPDEERKGYPWKHWFWGTYALDGRGWTREWVEARSPLLQHDYFAHDGGPQRSGAWLRHEDGWWRASQGGWDGRWQALFPDRER
jgi:hypothetical protein